ncbi:adhesion G-protein coupled receptor V1-like isoform X2 [Dysidea avara]|uniref:adhesion G-protein coupled receptor V1-like isoform X2 n=1 Tax=Dysidea avara TaxID=196820 RepID=UPI00332D4C52
MERWKEKFDISLSLPHNNPQVSLTKNKQKRVVRITDSTVEVNFDNSPYEVREDSDEVMIMMVLNQPSSKPFDVIISLMDLTAERGDDYRGQRTIAIPANQMSTSFAINIIKDNIAECDETFTLTLSVPSSPCGVISGSYDTSEVMIKDDDGVMLSFDQPQYSIEENITPLSVGLILNRTTSEDVIVEVSVNDGSAKAGIDYDRSGAPLVFNVTFSSGMTSSSSFDVDVIDNMVQDLHKMFFITIRLIPTCLPITVKSNTSNVTITDDEVLRIQFSSSSFSGSESSGEVIVSIVVLRGTEDRFVNIPISLNEGTATGNDFNSTPLIATIPAGATNTTVRIPVMSDNIAEGDEMFSMSLNIPSSLGPGIVAGSVTSATGIIVDSTTGIKIRFIQRQYTGSEDTGFVLVTLELVGGTSSKPFNVTVTPLEQSPLSAEGGIDFNNTTLTATFGSGMTTSSVSIPVVDDMLAEGRNETFLLMLSVPSSLGPAITAGGRDRAIGVIIDTTMLVVEFGSRNFRGSESSGHVEVVVIISGGSSITPIEVVVTPSEQSPVSARGSGVDFDSNPITIIFAVGENSTRVNVSVMADNLLEGEESFDIILSLRNDNFEVILGRSRATGRITDSTVLRIQFSSTTFNGSESAGEVIVVIRVSGGAATTSKNVLVYLNGMTANEGTDFTSTALTATIPANATTTTVRVPVMSDSIVEGDEMFSMSLNVPSSLGPGIVAGSVTSATGIIKDSTVLIMEFEYKRFVGSESSGHIEVVVIISGGSSIIPIEVVVTPFEQSRVSARGSGVDFDSNPINVTFGVGELSKTVNISVSCDGELEGDEKFNIMLSLPSNNPQVSLRTNKQTSIVRITDSTVEVNFDKSSYEVREDSDEVMIMIVLNQPSSKPFDVIINSVDVTTREGNDYLRSFGAVVNIPANMTSKLLMIYIIDDKTVEYSETFTLTLNVSSSSCGVISGSISTSEVMIKDDDASLFAVLPSPQTVQVGSTAMFTCNAVENGNSLMYSWSKTGETTMTVLNNSQISSSILHIKNVTVSDSGYYQCHVHNQSRIIASSAPTRLTVTVQITGHPVSVIAYENTAASLICRAEGSDPIVYQWKKVNREIADGRATGMNKSILTIYPVTEQDEGEYYCIVRNEGADGKVYNDTSQNAMVTVYAEFRDASDSSSSSTSNVGTIGIAVVSVLLIVAIVCIIGLVIWIIRLSKTNARMKSTEITSPASSHKPSTAEPTYELVEKKLSSDVNMENNPAYSVTGVLDSTPGHQYECIPVTNSSNAKQ